jgi:N-acetyl-anhydromuramyl-L-alanine amidase AmpD
MRLLICFIGLLFLNSCAITVPIVDKPIVFKEQRKKLTREYLENRYGITQENIQINPKMIVVHWTAIPTLEKSFDAFYNESLPNWRPELVNQSALNVSAQFLVDQDGTIYRLMPENHMARHVIGLNHAAIGIENVGGTKEAPLTKAQLKSNIKLIKYLKTKYAINYLIGHYEYTLFENHPLWKEVDEEYRTQKTDPGEAFMEKIRKATAKLKFKTNPSLVP